MKDAKFLREFGHKPIDEFDESVFKDDIEAEVYQECERGLQKKRQRNQPKQLDAIPEYVAPQNTMQKLLNTFNIVPAASKTSKRSKYDVFVDTDAVPVDDDYLVTDDVDWFGVQFDDRAVEQFSLEESVVEVGKQLVNKKSTAVKGRVVIHKRLQS